MKRHSVLKLEASTHKDVIRLLSSSVSVDTDKKTSVVTISRTGTFTDPRYGEFTLSSEMFEHMVNNFNTGVFGQDIAIDVAHKPENGAAGFVRKLFTDRNRLRAEVEWTAYGADAVRNKGYKYLSAEIHPNFTDNEHQKQHGVTLLGAGVVVRPCIKNLDPIDADKIQLAEAPQTPTYLTENVKQHIHNEVSTMWKELILALMAKLGGLKLSEDATTQVKKLAEAALKNVTEQPAAEAVLAELEVVAKQLAEANPSNVTLQLAAGSGLDESGVKALFSQLQAAEAQKLTDAKQALDAKRLIFTEAIDGTEGLSDEIKTQLKDKCLNLISADMADEQVKSLAELQLAHGQQLAANAQLQDMGFGNSPRGVVQLSGESQSNAMKLQELQHSQLRMTNDFAAGKLKLLTEENTPRFVKLVLAEFDRVNAQRIHNSVMALSGSSGANVISDSELPVGVQREVIREALSDLNILNLVQTLTDFTAQATTQIPYEERDVSNVVGDGVVYEFGKIPRIKNSQKMDLAYVLPMKVAFMVSNELLHLSRVSHINWDAWASNISTAARILREMIGRRLANEMQRISDAYLAGSVTSENIASQLDGSAVSFKTAQFPIVQPFQQYDMQGNTIGSPENPITLVVDGGAVTPFDGSGDQPAGTYYVISNHNLGYFALVDETGAVQAVDATAATIGYNYATNIAKVSSDIPAGVEQEKHLNKLLQAIGRRKATMKDDRFVQPDFLLMSNTLNDTCTNAEQFIASMKRDGSETTSVGDLEKVKGINSWETNAPGIHLGDERILMGQPGTLSYTITKSFSLSEMIEARDANGNIIGGKEAYGEEYNSIHCPKPIRNRFTSVLFYSEANR